MMRVKVWLLVLLAASSFAAEAAADVWFRWDRDELPPPSALGISRIVIPAENRRAIESAVSQGYDVYVEQGPEPRLVPYQPSKTDALEGRVVARDNRAKWPHIRSNVVTRRNEVLQVAGRSAQPWVETNAALLRILRSSDAERAPLVTYAWKPISGTDADQEPGLESYLLAIAEAGSFGGDLLLPVHPRLAGDLLLGQPQARAAWKEIRGYADFYAWPKVSGYKPIANVAVVTADPIKSFELMNLLSRHNVPFELIDPKRLAERSLTPFKLVVTTDAALAGSEPLAAFARAGGTVVTRPQIGDPNQFAMEMRQTLGADNRVIDIWNGITVVTAPYEAPDGKTVLVTAVNYAQQPLPVQLRVRGTFSQVYFESPGSEPALVAFEHRNGFTEFVLPSLRIGGRVFLTMAGSGR